MSLRKQQHETGKGGALVLANSSAVMRQASSLDQAVRDHAPNIAKSRVNVATRSVFLAQLASQYESKGAARARRMEARAVAMHRYDEKPPKPALRHLTWA